MGEETSDPSVAVVGPSESASPRLKLVQAVVPLQDVGRRLSAKPASAALLIVASLMADRTIASGPWVARRLSLAV